MRTGGNQPFNRRMRRAMPEPAPLGTETGGARERSLPAATQVPFRKVLVLRTEIGEDRAFDNV